MFPLKLLNRLRLAGEVIVEVAPTLPEHTALVVVRPQVDPELVEGNKGSRRRVYVEENILSGFSVNHIEIETRQIDLWYSEAVDDLKPTINERFFVASEDDLANLVLRWTRDLSGLCSYLPNKYSLDFDL